MPTRNSILIDDKDFKCQPWFKIWSRDLNVKSIMTFNFVFKC